MRARLGSRPLAAMLARFDTTSRVQPGRPAASVLYLALGPCVSDRQPIPRAPCKARGAPPHASCQHAARCAKAMTARPGSRPPPAVSSGTLLGGAAAPIPGRDAPGRVLVALRRTATERWAGRALRLQPSNLYVRALGNQQEVAIRMMRPAAGGWAPPGSRPSADQLLASFRRSRRSAAVP
jgi:hypothetical protein